jgi:hypothetical protein
MIDELKEEIERFWEVNENKNMTYQAVLRGKFIAMTAYVKRTDRYQINDLMLHLKFLEKQQ